MVLLYKLPRHTPCAIPLDLACTVEAAREYIKTHNQIMLPFKLRVHVGGAALFLKASQTLEEVAAMGAEVIGVNYNDQPAMQSARRKLAKETAALVRTDVREDGDKTREQVRLSMDAVKECIRDEVKKCSSGANNRGGFRRGGRGLVGSKVVATQPDEEMGDEVFEICHVEVQTWVDDEKHTVCIIKAEGKPNLSRELKSLAIHDPLISRDATQSVRVVVAPHQVEHTQYHIGWRGIVQAAKASAPNVKVNFPLLKMGKIVHVSMMVPRTALHVLGDDDVSMLPNTHPWLGRRVTTVQSGQTGEIVDVNSKGRVKVALEGPEKKKMAIFVESKGISFEALFNVEPKAEAPPALPDPPQADEAAPQALQPPQPPQPPAMDVEPQVASREDPPLADSDAESEPPKGDDSDDDSSEPILPAPKKRAKQSAKAAGSAEDPKLAPKRRTGKQPAKASAAKGPADDNAESKSASKRKGEQPAQAPKRRRKVSVDVD